MRTERLAFARHRGDRLAAYLDRADHGEPVGYVLFAHCFTCTKNLKAVQRIDTALTDQGFGVLRFDFTGLGESEGDFAATNFSSNVEPRGRDAVPGALAARDRAVERADAAIGRA